jgi:hypothetical protein
MLKAINFLIKLIFTLVFIPCIGLFCVILSLVFWKLSFIDFPYIVQTEIWASDKK